MSSEFADEKAPRPIQRKMRTSSGRESAYRQARRQRTVRVIAGRLGGDFQRDGPRLRERTTIRRRVDGLARSRERGLIVCSNFWKVDCSPATSLETGAVCALTHRRYSIAAVRSGRSIGASSISAAVASNSMLRRFVAGPSQAHGRRSARSRSFPPARERHSPSSIERAPSRYRCRASASSPRAAPATAEDCEADVEDQRDARETNAGWKQIREQARKRAVRQSGDESRQSQKQRQVGSAHLQRGVKRIGQHDEERHTQSQQIAGPDAITEPTGGENPDRAEAMTPTVCEYTLRTWVALEHTREMRRQV